MMQEGILAGTSYILIIYLWMIDDEESSSFVIDLIILN